MEEFILGICDDMEKDRENIRLLCERFFQNKDVNYSVIFFSSGEEVISYTGARLHLLFLDIEMKEVDGIQVLRKLESSNYVWRVVFVTSHPEMVFDSFGIKTLGFEKKPVVYEKLEKWLQIAIQEHQDNFMIECNGVDGKQWVELEDIVFLEAQRNYVRIHMKEEEIFVSGNLRTWENKMNGTPVIRVHKTYLVNLIHVSVIGKEIVLKSGIKIPIGRQYKSLVLEKYHSYICKIAERRI